ncbi:uncharacterized protein [Dendrobates tinctorius]|uniref:uncharacterized protein isoform X2 n=1 Tax=Dendrobates tinctorius TaxID=92724 RepID=UPI003CC92E56
MELLIRKADKRAARKMLYSNENASSPLTVNSDTTMNPELAEDQYPEHSYTKNMLKKDAQPLLQPQVLQEHTYGPTQIPPTKS